jgi:hypothetical protein
VAVPALIVALFYRQRAWQSFLWLMAGMLVDVDHLLANPIYDPARCSIGFHPLHTWPAWVVYAGLLCWPKTRVLGLGLAVHMLLDAGDCVL